MLLYGVYIVTMKYNSRLMECLPARLDNKCDPSARSSFLLCCSLSRVGAAQIPSSDQVWSLSSLAFSPNPCFTELDESTGLAKASECRCPVFLPRYADGSEMCLLCCVENGKSVSEERPAQHRCARFFRRRTWYRNDETESTSGTRRRRTPEGQRRRRVRFLTAKGRLRKNTVGGVSHMARTLLHHHSRLQESERSHLRGKPPRSCLCTSNRMDLRSGTC